MFGITTALYETVSYRIHGDIFICRQRTRNDDALEQQG